MKNNKKEVLEIKNFGPIREVNLDLNKITLFIGPQGSGKSTISKLISIFRDKSFLLSDDKDRLHKFLKVYNLESFLKKESFFRYENNNYKLLFSKEKLTFEMSNDYKNLLKKNAKKLSDFLGLKENPKLTEIKIKHDEVKQKYYNQLESIISNLKDFNDDDIEKNSPILSEISNFIEIGQAFDRTIHNFQKNSVYIPAERIMISTLSEISFQIWKNDISLPEYIINFGAEFQKSRQELKSSSIDFLDISYQYSKKTDKIKLKKGGKLILLSQASSGIQSIIPLYLVFQNLNKTDLIETTFVVEEPELHLFPETQDRLIEYLISNILKNKDELVITTHSPYVLSSLNKFMYADKVSKIKGKKNQVAKIVKISSCLPSENLNCYLISNGKCTNIMDNETGLISVNELDNISNKIANQFNELVDIQLGE